ncbi:MAG: PIN domain-containing protein [Acidobacteria bacterium]|nr:MAG: PIN domain-containing protein [Acidobacteriota bacterium]
MIAVDTNILLYAHRAELPWNSAASELLKKLSEGAERWAIPWPCIHEFLGVATNPRAFKPPTPLPAALRQVELWMASPSLRLLGEAAGYWERLQELVQAGHLAGSVIHDAHVAALCLQHGVEELWSADRDFSRMRGLRVRNPLL